jgi:hypothetical protein
MPATRRYRLRDAAMQVPMPDRGGRLFTASPEGEAVNTEDRFYATMIADGDLIEVEPAPRAKGKR